MGERLWGIPREIPLAKTGLVRARFGGRPVRRRRKARKGKGELVAGRLLCVLSALFFALIESVGLALI